MDSGGEHPAINLQTVAAAGFENRSNHWMKKLLRRILWRQLRPYFVAFAKETERVIFAKETERVIAATVSKEGPVPSQAEEAVSLFVPPGHFYSPIVNPQELTNLGFSADRTSAGLLGINCDMKRMCETFSSLASLIHDLDFPEQMNSEYRYYHKNDMFHYGGALILAGMIRKFRPKRIIEVGSGFSSASILDTLDRTQGMDGTICTFIEPNQGRLRSILRPQDDMRVEIINQQVQTVAISNFERLEAGDILFLDTTHIVKTGSDVVYELFQILPRLASGVIIHFHDVMTGFEYFDHWIFGDNRSWNEVYALRAFLMYNDVFEILFYTDQFIFENEEIVRKECPRLAKYPDGGLWIRKNG